jgi:hypothetical protein
LQPDRGGPNPGAIGQYAAIQGAAPSFKVELSPVDLGDLEEFQRALTAFAREPNGGLIVPPSALAVVRRDLIIKFAAQQALPAVYGVRSFVTSGGLISYGPAFAVLRLMIVSYLVGACTGRSAGFSPLRMRST